MYLNSCTISNMSNLFHSSVRYPSPFLCSEGDFIFNLMYSAVFVIHLIITMPTTVCEFVKGGMRDSVFFRLFRNICNGFHLKVKIRLRAKNIHYDDDFLVNKQHTTVTDINRMHMTSSISNNFATLPIKWTKLRYRLKNPLLRQQYK